jgi:hypothetical protein
MDFNELHKITDRRYGVFRKKATLGVGVSVTVLWPNELHGAQSLISFSAIQGIPRISRKPKVYFSPNPPDRFLQDPF